MNILMVGEKPSISAAIAAALAPNNCDLQSLKRHGVEGAPPVYEFQGNWRKTRATFKITSVAGHVFSFDFPDSYQDWDLCDPVELFDAPLVKKPTKGSVVSNLRECGRGCDFLVLWLDCDREGENIAFEVIDIVAPVMSGSRKLGGNGGILRAKFSAVNPSDILSAMNSLVAPNKDISNAVACRQELDLRLGVAFSRFQTLHFRDRFKGLDSKLLSYGPCQTPTLGFVVQRHIEIQSHVPEKYYELSLSLTLNDDREMMTSNKQETDTHDAQKGIRKDDQFDDLFREESLTAVSINKNSNVSEDEESSATIMKKGDDLRGIHLKWSRGRCFDSSASGLFFTRCLDSQAVAVVDVEVSDYNVKRPLPLNTVDMLKKASKTLGIGPHRCMSVAEQLYLQGYISYPRTESTAYPKSMELSTLVKMQIPSSQWGEFAAQLIQGNMARPRGGVDAGDHPPITPMKFLGGSGGGGASEETDNDNDGGRVGSEGWRLYSMITRHFLATLSQDAKYVKTKVIALTCPTPLPLKELKRLKYISRVLSEERHQNQDGNMEQDDSSKEGDTTTDEGRLEEVEESTGLENLQKGKGGKGNKSTGKWFRKGKGKGKGKHQLEESYHSTSSSASQTFDNNQFMKLKLEKENILAKMKLSGEEFTTSSDSCILPGHLSVITNSIKSSKPPNLAVGDYFNIHNFSSCAPSPNDENDVFNNNDEETSLLYKFSTMHHNGGGGGGVSSSLSVKGHAQFTRKSAFTDPPSYLTESELISIMEKQGIGTDASIPTHIENIQKRKYAVLEPGRKLKPTQLGVVLVQGYFRIDSDLVLPELRKLIELECDAIADGVKDKNAVVHHAIACFREKYQYFVANVSKMEPLFESSFSMVPEDKGKPFSRCGVSQRYLNLILNRVPRLYNPITEEHLLLPKGGTYHLSSHTNLGNCKICSSELIIYQLPDQRKYPLCAWCYNHPQEDLWGPAPYPITSRHVATATSTSTVVATSTRSASSVCYEAPLGDLHPVNYCRSICSLKNENELHYETGEYHVDTFAAEKEAKLKNKHKQNSGRNGSGGGGGQLGTGGVLILEPSLSTGGAIRFISTRSEVNFTLPKPIEKIELLPIQGMARPIKVHFHPQFTPLDHGETVYVGNLMEDEFLQSMLHVKTSTVGGSSQASLLSPYGMSAGARNRGGRRDEGKGEKRKPRKPKDPKMSFQKF